MTELSPESIEGIDKADIQAIRNLAGDLHEATAPLIDTPLSPQELNRQEELRTATNLKISEAMNELDSQMADLEAVKKELRIWKGYTASDKERIKSRKIEGYIREKEERFSSTRQ